MGLKLAVLSAGEALLFLEVSIEMVLELDVEERDISSKLERAKRAMFKRMS